MNKYQIRFVSKNTHELVVKSGYSTKREAEKHLEKSGYSRNGEIWDNDGWWAKIWAEN